MLPPPYPPPRAPQYRPHQRKMQVSGYVSMSFAADGIVVFDATTFLQWKPKSPHLPTALVRYGQLLVDGPGASEARPPPEVVAAPRVVRRDRWSVLCSCAVSGRLSLQSFVETFGTAGADAKKAAYRAGKRLRDTGFHTPEDEPTGNGHWARKVARIVDIRKAYPELAYRGNKKTKQNTCQHWSRKFTRSTQGARGNVPGDIGGLC